MSYTSKYTGPEIDSLLDQINVGGGQYTTLWEGTAKSLDITFTLVDGIENYDMILILGGRLYDDKNYSNTTSCLVPSQLLKEGGCLHGQTIRTGAYGNSSYNYTVAVKFTSNTTFVIGEVKEAGWVGACVHRIYGIKLGGSVCSVSNPIGAIVPIMGTQAPKDHLICDGSELNISEYKELADYFEAQFGSKDYFGGDGINTFAIPDLRNEFLRGYGELSGEVGEHQDATTIPYNFNYYNAPAQDYTFTTNMKNGETNSVKNADALFVEEQTRLYRDMWVGKPGASDNTSKTPYAFNPRPTNVAVLFCIKYTESGSANGGSGYREKELLSTPVDYALKNSATILNAELELSDDITNYDELAIDCTVARSSDGGHTCTGQIRLLVSQISYNTSNDYTKVADGSTIPLNVTCHGGGTSIFMATCSTYFKNFTTLAIGYTVSSNNNYNKFRIRSIKGIKH